MTTYKQSSHNGSGSKLRYQSPKIAGTVIILTISPSAQKHVYRCLLHINCFNAEASRPRTQIHLGNSWCLARGWAKQSYMKDGKILAHAPRSDIDGIVCETFAGPWWRRLRIEVWQAWGQSKWFRISCKGPCKSIVQWPCEQLQSGGRKEYGLQQLLKSRLMQVSYHGRRKPLGMTNWAWRQRDWIHVTKCKVI